MPKLIRSKTILISSKRHWSCSLVKCYVHWSVWFPRSRWVYLLIRNIKHKYEMAALLMQLYVLHRNLFCVCWIIFFFPCFCCWRRCLHSFAVRYLRDAQPLPHRIDAGNWCTSTKTKPSETTVRWASENHYALRPPKLRLTAVVFDYHLCTTHQRPPASVSPPPPYPVVFLFRFTFAISAFYIFAHFNLFIFKHRCYLINSYPIQRYNRGVEREGAGNRAHTTVCLVGRQRFAFKHHVIQRSQHNMLYASCLKQKYSQHAFFT